MRQESPASPKPPLRVYFSGLAGTALGPLAEFAQDAGFSVCGSDLARGAISDELDARGIPARYGPQDGTFLRTQIERGGIDWFVYTSALPPDHPELALARRRGLRVSKRDEFIAEIIHQRRLKMLAVAGTHGKTTTTAMLIWAFKKLKIPVSYLVGTTLGWAPGGDFDPNSQFFVYEADEYDRNFLAYHPYLSLITVIDYDHADIYPTLSDYQAAFRQFESQSKQVLKDVKIHPGLTLIGELRRLDASFALEALKIALGDAFNEKLTLSALNAFPGAGRRFERLTSGIYSDYAHHPIEIRATVKMALELKEREHFAGLALIYQPHQNTRQHEVRAAYRDAFFGVDRLFWLPTYLTRENPTLSVLRPSDFIVDLKNPAIATPAELDDALAAELRALRAKNWLIILLSAGPADLWLRHFVTDADT